MFLLTYIKKEIYKGKDKIFKEVKVQKGINLGNYKLIGNYKLKGGSIQDIYKLKIVIAIVKSCIFLIFKTLSKNKLFKYQFRILSYNIKIVIINVININGAL